MVSWLRVRPSFYPGDSRCACTSCCRWRTLACKTGRHRHCKSHQFCV